MGKVWKRYAMVLLAGLGGILLAGCMTEIAMEESGSELSDSFSDSEHASVGETVQSLTGIRQIKTRHSGMCLDIKGASSSNKAKVTQWPCHGGNNQKFTFSDLGNGYHSIIAHHSGKCLDVEGASAARGASLIQYDCHGGTNQQFAIEDAGGGYVHLVARNSSKCLDLRGASAASGAAVIQWSCHGGYHQQFKIF